ncbi:MAG: hypothetical protein EWV83_11170 [Microcystis sp. M_OC_Ca_00000000_S217Cul]|jgi:hypothetical protein|uniref:RiboL-PSP-HEPN domain-containing protein n=1 Tax=Microcystis aeruginosa BLCC-F108 TaxID=2755317 RepID=A0A841UFW6_MICAE|nr:MULTISPECIES: hypothetical protein [Microcystis]MBC1189863.1 hypothetical protein [Microcystis aeruginosa BLCC-F108]MCA2593105.1 hypothetical protein [Microcystis sp. M31BS1]MDB9407434.1 hypothetical protein [Microcystis aeruginosa CS-558/01A06]TRT76356.1 MAG: hypothetical protein EWV83_11170 [Microcystis sp. M_OC_Ca_00000000_S217Cul]TRT90024.1 MAG: hypothetical protein EWV66_09155 [Microcystis sp. M_OC_Ca_00000000_C217Col]
MNNIPDKYIDLMAIVRKRLDVIDKIKSLGKDDFYLSETVAFHGRKIIEAIAFSCLLAVDNSLKSVPKDAKGQYNAEKIFKTLKKQGINALQNPSSIRQANQEEKIQHNVNVVIEGIPAKCLTYDELISIYQNLHNWLHELNPYTKKGHIEFNNTNQEQLWDDISRLEGMIEHHAMLVEGIGFYCTLRDKVTGDTKMIPISKISDI